MTFIVKTRGAGALLMAEYRCPEHGVFEVLVERDANGDAPDAWPCPEVGAAYAFESVDDFAAAVDGECDLPDAITAPCEYPSPWTISAPKTQFWSKPCTAVVKGGDMKDRPPGMLDTRPLAEGMKYSEWKKIQREDIRRRRHKQFIDKGIIQKKVIVG